MTEQELAEIRQRAEKATPGPMTEQIVELSWSTEDEPQYGYWVNDADGDIFAHVWSEDDMKFVSHSRQDIPALIAEVRRLNEENARLTTELQRMTIERIADEHGWSAVESMMQADNVRLKDELAGADMVAVDYKKTIDRQNEYIVWLREALEDVKPYLARNGMLYDDGDARELWEQVSQALKGGSQ